MKDPNNISKKAHDAFEKMTNPQPLKASDDFFEKVMAKVDQATEPAQTAVIHTFSWKDSLKYAALIAIMALNGILVFQAYSDGSVYAGANNEDIDALITDYYPEYTTLTEED